MFPPYAHPLALERLADARKGGELNLFAAAVAIATHADPTVQPRDIYQQMDRMVRDVQLLRNHDNPLLASLRHVVFDRWGFLTIDEPGDLSLSLMHQVFMRRRGLPAMVCLLLAELARRMGASASGLALPGRFLVAMDIPGDARILMEPVAGGRIVTPDDCQQRITDAGMPWREDFLTPMTETAWLECILMTIHQCHAKSGDYAQQAAALEMMVLIGDDSRRQELDHLYRQLAMKAVAKN